MGQSSTIAEHPQVNIAPFRGPSEYQENSQYYQVLNHFLTDGARVRRYARFKRIGDKQGWGQPEYREGLELDRQFFYGKDLHQCGARMAELVEDGCEIISYKKHPAPGGLVTYLLCSWPTNAELERNRAARVLRKQTKQAPLPREATPFRRPQPYHTAEVAGKRERSTTRHEDATRFEMEFHVKPRPSTAPSTTQATIDLPLFPDKGQP